METFKNSTVTIMVSNMNTSIEFYTGTLGLTLKARYGDHYAEVEGPGLLIGLHPTTNKLTPGGISVGFGVSDFDATKTSLEEKGIDLKVTQDDPIRLAHFADPDGNPLFLAEI